ncbi:MAG: LPS-assembly protein LptD [Saprospiraceae bacterium]|nr:LPS-assembly protein LptD [Saprospiraceae bacterium]
MCLLLATATWAQVPDSISQPVDSLLLSSRDTLTPVGRDSAVIDLSGILFSSQGLDTEVDYNAKDSMWFDITKKQVHLYGGASVKYTTLNIKAGYIILDYEKNEISAEQLPDSTGQLTGLPDFNDGEQSFTATKLRYNFKTRKGIIYEARTQQEDMYVLGAKAKFIGSPDDGIDTTRKSRNTIYNQNAILTTCDAPHPHYGIRTKKLKVIPDKLVVTGFSNLELGGVPTPLVIPFGFFPITKTRKAGLIIPRDFQGRRAEGLGINDLGWYQPISEHADATVLFRAFTSGTIGVTGNLRYSYRYKYGGDLRLTYNKRVTEDQQANKVAAKSFAIQLSHNQDPKAHPSRKLNGSINIQTNRDQNRNQNDFQSVYENTLTSNMSFTKTFPGKPYNFSAALRHSQNTQTRQMDITLPSVNFTMQRVFPFKRKVSTGEKDRWYEKISLTYSSRLDNSFRTVDTLLFTQQTLDNARMGMQHQASSDYQFKLFKYITISPNVRYEENWYPYTIKKELDPSVIKIVRDTTLDADGNILAITENDQKSKYGEVVTSREWAFNSFRKYDAGVSANTVLFFTKQMKKGWLRGFRHKMTPAMSVGFGPDFSKQQDRYFKTYYTDLRSAFNDTLRYGIYDEAIYTRPDLGKRNIAISYSLGNVLEFKHYSARKDTVLKKRIFDNLSFAGSYSLTADSLKWSTISPGGLFRLFKGLSNLTWNVTFDPYIADARGNRINRFVIHEKGRLLRVTNLGFALNTGFTVKQMRDLIAGKDQNQTPQNNQNSLASKDDILGLFDNFRISHRVSLARQLIPTGIGTARDTFVIGTNNLSFSGSIQLTSKWSLDLGNISYDFPSKQLVYPDIGFTRDLHCWSLSFRWQPDRGTYSFFIGVKPGTLEFLKVPYRKDYYDTGF